MTRHGKNCSAGAVYTYNERKKDNQESGYGTSRKRLCKDSVKSFDCCSLTLQRCRNPVITKDGYLFDKEAILQYIITKKNEYSRKLKEYEKIRKSEDQQVEAEVSKKKRARMDGFLNSERSIAKKMPALQSQASISNMSNGHETKLPSFWMPSQGPDAGLAKAQKPDSTIYCPVSMKPLRVKDLIDVKFTVIDENHDKALVAQECRYICPVTRDMLSNAIPCAVLRPTGDVVTMECVETLIKKDWMNPLTGLKLKEKDIIPLQRGGTGYAITNENLEGKEKRPAMQA